MSRGRERERMSESQKVNELEDLRQAIAGYLEIYDLDKVKSYQAANEVLKMCERAGLRKFVPAKTLCGKPEVKYAKEILDIATCYAQGDSFLREELRSTMHIAVFQVPHADNDLCRAIALSAARLYLKDRG